MATILTLDAGTSALKCSLFHTDGTLKRAYAAEYPTCYPCEGWAEQKAEELLAAAVRATRALSEDGGLDDVCAVGLTGTMNGCIALTETGEALRPNIIHLDTRAQREVDHLTEALGMRAFYEKTGNRPDVHYGLPKAMWLKAHEPDVYRRARWLVNTKDLIYGFLTGVYGRSDYSDASLFGALNIHTRAWDEDVVHAAGVDLEKLPRLLPSHDVSGRVSAAAARLTGLREGTPVAVGAGDGPCSTHGSGVFADGQAYLTVGSSAWVCGLSRTARMDEAMRIFHYTDMDERLVNVCGTVQCAATALDFYLKTVLGLTNERGEIDFPAAEALAQDSVPGARGLFFLPTLMGERCPWWDSAARGILAGLTLTHTRADMVRAGYEGVAQALNNCVDALRENGMTVDRLTLSGGGVKSRVWPQMFADVCSAVTCIHVNPRETTSLGAAMAAGVGAGVYASFADAAKIVHTRDERRPDPETAAAYRRHTAVYRALYSQMKDAMHAASRYQATESGGNHG